MKKAPQFFDGASGPLPIGSVVELEKAPDLGAKLDDVNATLLQILEVLQSIDDTLTNASTKAGY